MSDKSTMGTAAAAMAASLALGGAAFAQDAATQHVSPAWDTLVRCAEMTNDEAQLACYNTAMRQAGYAPKPETVAAASAERHRRFGLSLPSINLRKKHSSEEGAQAAAATAPAQAAPETEASPQAPAEDENHVTVTLNQVIRTPPLNRFLFITSEGAIWEQKDDETIAPAPKPGQKMVIRRGRIGGFFCAFDKRNAARCERVR